ncbi:MAG: phospholipase [Rubripirellula sp.]|jgi:predicted  nucleic acid-binding Zn-ribbon protein|nr:phospholipase [Rubripirellula sp.]
MTIDSKTEIKPELLRRLHRIHRQRTDLKGRIDRGPKQIKAGESLVTQAEAATKEIRSRLTKTTMISDEKQLQLKSRETRIDELGAKLNTAASNREFTTLKEQIAADKQANSVLSDEILEVMEQMDAIEIELEAADAELEKQQQEQEQRIKDVKVVLAELAEESKRVEAELSSVEKEIPSNVFPDYKRLTDSKGENALAPVEGESCGGCYQTLTTNYIDRLRMSRLIRCPNCNAFLYTPEDLRVK